jgi:CRP-like cAMP-binding protein
MFRHTPIDDELARVPLLDGISPKQLGWVPRLSTPLELPAGKVLAHQGTMGAEFLIVLDGWVEVVQGNRLVVTRGPGSPLGEISLLGDRPRTATLIAETPVRARVASRREFAGLLAEIPELSARLHETMAERLASSTTTSP